MDMVFERQYWVVKILVKKINWRCPNLLSLLRLRAFRPSRSSPVSRSREHERGYPIGYPQTVDKVHGLCRGFFYV